MEMKKLMTKITGHPMWIVLIKFWQGPQMVLGVLVQWIYEIKDGIYTSYGRELHSGPYPYVVAVLQTRLIKGAVTIGDSIIMPDCNKSSAERIFRHEAGHVLQSIILGPLYLFVIGIPSLTWAALHTWCKPVAKRWAYEDFYTEAWAERLSKKYFADGVD